MILQSNIGWCDDTSNAVTGCDKVSEGCKHCYAQMGTRARVLRAMGIETWGANGVRHPVKEFATKIRRLNKLCICDACHRTHPADLLSTKTLQGGEYRPTWCFECGGSLRHIRLFADSNSDWLDEKWPIETFAAFLKEIHDAPNVDVLLLTKRPENFELRIEAVVAMIETMPELIVTGAVCSRQLSQLRDWLCLWQRDKAPTNIWLGVSVENQKMADLRIPQLLGIPAAVRFLSCEPLLDSVRFRWAKWDDHSPHPKRIIQDPPVMRKGRMLAGCVDELDGLRMLDWVIVGGESGKNRRAVDVGAITNIAEQCLAAGVPVYVKQDVAFKSGEQGRISDEIWKLKQFPRQGAAAHCGEAKETL